MGLEAAIPDYRIFLREELEIRQKRNPRYSVRAFARDLGLSPAFLSQLLSRKKLLSEDKSMEISRFFDWTSAKRKVFTQLCRYEITKSPEVKKLILSELASTKSNFQKAFRLKLDEFALISEWYHLALVELVEIKDFVSDVDWMSKKLGITKATAIEGLKRLERMGMLEQVSGVWRKTHSFYTVGEVPSEAIKHFHQQMLEKARQAILVQPIQERDYSAITMAIDPKRIKEARKRIKQFRQELMEYLEGGERLALYQFNLQLFRLDIKDEEFML